MNFVSANTNVATCSELKQALINSNDDITLTADIDCNNSVWQDWDTLTPPMGEGKGKSSKGDITIQAASYTRQYTNATFDGQGHIISNLYINTSTSTTNYNGFIPYATSTNSSNNLTDIIIKDVLFRDITVIGGCSAGIVVGRANTNTKILRVGVENSYVEGNTWCSTSAGVGGFVGYMGSGGKIEDSYFQGTVISNAIDSTNPNCKASGLVGELGASATNWILINRSYSVAELKCLGGGIGYMKNAGGIIGYKGSYINVSNSFTASHINLSNNASDFTNHGSVFGYAAGALPTGFAKNVWFDINRSGTSQCRQIVSGNGNVTSCFGVNATGVNSTYFYNKLNAPLNTWNFTDVWMEVNGSYSVLKEFERTSCTPNLQNTTKSDWQNTTCSLGQMNQSRFWIQYDSNNCGGGNQTFYEYQLTGPTWENGSWSGWYNITGCLIGDYYVQEQNMTQTDIFGCTSSNIFFSYQNQTCDFCTPDIINTTKSSWINSGCSGTQMIQTRSWIEYDSNACADYNFTNVTHQESQLVGPIWQNTTTSWMNLTCIFGDLMNQTRSTTQFDIFQCAANTTFIEYQLNGACDFCLPNLQNTTWSEWENITTCELNGTNIQQRSLVEYDSNACADHNISNITYFENQEVSCVFVPEENFSLCYQETANESNINDGNCTLNYSGSYSIEGSNKYFAYLSINYTKPTNSQSASWRVKHGLLSNYSVEIPSDCFSNSNNVQLRFYSEFIARTGAVGYASYGQCFNGTSWNTITNISEILTDATTLLISGNPSSMYDGDWNSGALYYREGTWLDAASQDYNPYAARHARIYEEAIIWDVNNSVKEEKKKEVNSIDPVIISNPLTPQIISEKKIKITKKTTKKIKAKITEIPVRVPAVKEVPKIIILNGRKSFDSNIIFLN